MDSGSGSKSKDFTLHHYTKTIFDKEREFNHPFPLHDYFAPMIGDKKEVKIADLGAGMFSTTGNLKEGIMVKVYPSDVLADEYNQILKEFSIVPIIPIEKQEMESLTYPDEFFDIVHSVNALDHCLNPHKALKEMYRVCKSGGWIYLRHHFNTAKLQKKRGMHKWNITMTINRDCIFWGDLGCFLLSDCIPGFVNVPKKELAYERNDMIVSKLKK